MFKAHNIKWSLFW